MFSIGLSQDKKYDIYSHLMLKQHQDDFDCFQLDNYNFPQFSEHSSIRFDQSSIENVYFESFREDHDFWSAIAQFNVESWGKYTYLFALNTAQKLHIIIISIILLIIKYVLHKPKWKIIGEVEINFSSSFHSKHLFESSFDDWVQIRFEKELSTESNKIIQNPLQIFNTNTQPLSINSSGMQTNTFPIKEIKQDKQSSSNVKLYILLVQKPFVNNNFGTWLTKFSYSHLLAEVREWIKVIVNISVSKLWILKNMKIWTII